MCVYTTCACVCCPTCTGYWWGRFPRPDPEDRSAHFGRRPSEGESGWPANPARGSAGSPAYWSAPPPSVCRAWTICTSPRETHLCCMRPGRCSPGWSGCCWSAWPSMTREDTGLSGEGTKKIWCPFIHGSQVSFMSAWFVCLLIPRITSAKQCNHCQIKMNVHAFLFSEYYVI